MFRPRFRRCSLRRLILLGSALLIFLILVVNLTPATRRLPQYTGRYDVGVLDLEVEVEKRVIKGFGDVMLKGVGEKAFELQTLALTLYYPSTPPAPSPKSPRSPPHARPWLPQPISLIGTGYARIANIYFPPLQSLFSVGLWLFGRNIMIPGTVDAPLLSPGEISKLAVEGGRDGNGNGGGGVELREGKNGDRDGEEKGELPCVVFTHGMGRMSQSYSHYLGSVASYGVVVAAIEHRDGSGPGTIIHRSDGSERTVWHLGLKDLENDPPMTAPSLIAAQLAFREAEIKETIRLFRLLNAGHGDLLINLKPDSPRTVLPAFKDRLNISAVTVVGHSYGATGTLQALKNAPNEEMPINGAIALDPGKQSGKLNTEVGLPVLVMNSGAWTEKQTKFYELGWHFVVVKDLVKNIREGWFMTLAGSAHPSCTDVPLIIPWIMKIATWTSLNAKVALAEYVDVSVEFLNYLKNGEKKGVLKSRILSPAGPLGDSKMRKKIRGTEGAAWEIHVVPEKK
ncbi:uncharacterized protein BDR25DRAFT_323182 [Lindgomyces ingoldianus]|uniref:Uncharacterized protein n=1 Tax=Lindgomyces ingoldianus TaxID=673940 RepID=A0ACB6R4D4_9PLEO|nr:uncharacterized protein BDR25DRAFT_323182 [Lindgomyces ingoldianus]KAF2474133.1 hypothetical protein BDR25DRAFT_323182 [Lindgomyces ingoldianus]